MLIESGKVTYKKMVKEPPVITTREQLKKDATREEFKNLITQVGEKQRMLGQKK